MANQLTRKPIYKNQTIGFLVEKLLKIPYFKVAAVIFIVLTPLLITRVIAGNSDDFAIGEEEETIIKGSSVYASEYLNPDEKIIEESYFSGEFFDDSNVIIQDCTFVANNSPAAISPFLAERSGIITYEVQPGDIPSEIAVAFGISTNTLLWANNLSPWNSIKPGQKLVILPVSGIKHTIKSGETLDKIVSKYKGDLEKTIAINGLPASGALTVGQDIIIPDGQKPVEYVPKSRIAYAPEELGPYGDESHKFPWGQCTWYVAQKRYIPWGGNAKNWLKSAIAYGFATGTEPQLGAILVSKENRYYGHVAYVEAVEGDYITVSEMNLGAGIKKVRTLRKDDWRIVGYIY